LSTETAVATRTHGPAIGKGGRRRADSNKKLRPAAVGATAPAPGSTKEAETTGGERRLEGNREVTPQPGTAASNCGTWGTRRRGRWTGNRKPVNTPAVGKGERRA